MENYFCRSTSGPPFEGAEEKKYEFCRYGSFKDWPCECPIFPLNLAKVGFFSTKNRDEVACYVCGARKSGWKEGDDPETIHRGLNSNCQFFSEGFEDNVPVSASAVSGEEVNNSQRLSDLDQLLDCVALGDSLTAEERRNNNLETEENLDDNSNVLGQSVSSGGAAACSGIENDSPTSRQSQRLPCVAKGEGQSGLPKSKSSDSVSSNTSAGSSEGAGCNITDAERINSQASANSKNQGNRKKQGHDIPPPTGAAIGPLRYERNRLATFKKWPCGAKVSAADLAKSGFTYTGSGDRVQCVFCKGILRNWEEGDRPHIEHRKHFPRCPLILGIEKGNVPLPLGQTSRQYVSNTATQGGSQPILNIVEGMPSLGITTDRPKHSQFAIEAQRVASFHNWPAYKHQTPQQLAEAGFFYAGFGDNVKCFYCNGGLRNWEKGDDPWHEHARWFKTCPYVLMVKGHDYVNSVSEERKEDEPILTQANRNAEGSTIAELPPTAAAAAAAIPHEVEEREVKARMDRPHVKVVEEMGIKRDLIMSVIRRRLQEVGDDFPSATALLEAVFLMEEESKGQSTTQNGPQLIEQDSVADIAENGAQEHDENETKTSTTEDPEATQGQMKRSASMPEGSLNNADLLKENTELKEQKLCKICMVSDANVVFLPCGHLVSCASCAPALPICPICRAGIQGHVRTYMS